MSEHEMPTSEEVEETMEEEKESEFKQYPGNAHYRPGRERPVNVPVQAISQGEKSEKPKVEKIVTGEVIKQKKSRGRKFRDFFLGADGTTVREYIICDVIVPAIKNVILDSIYAFSDGIGGGVEMLLFGERGARRGRSGGIFARRNSNQTYVPYDQVGNRGRALPARQLSPASRARHDFDELIIADRVEAEHILENMFEQLAQYGLVAVADLYSMAGITPEYTDQNWGWSDLRGSQIVRVPNGYLLDMPQPIYLGKY